MNIVVHPVLRSEYLLFDVSQLKESWSSESIKVYLVDDGEVVLDQHLHGSGSHILIQRADVLDVGVNHAV